MPYCSVDDIKADFKGIVFDPETGDPDTDTSTTEEQLLDWIQQESNYIDGRIAKIYSLPIDTTLTQAMDILKRICIFRIAERVVNKNELKEAIIQKNSDEKYLKNKVRTPNDDLNDIQSGDLLLIGATRVDNTGGFSSFGSSSAGKCCPRVFDTCKQEW